MSSCLANFTLIVYLKILLDFLHINSFHLQIMIVLFFSFLILLPFVSYLTILIRTYSTNRNDENVFFFSHNLSGKAFNISSTRDLLYIKKNYLFIWLPRVLVAAHGIFTVSLGMFHCSADSLVAVPGFQQVGFSICGTWS